MKERPILFNGEMVRAILSGRKTQTRRECGLEWTNMSMPDMWDSVFMQDDGALFTLDDGGIARETFIKCPFGKIGDRLWVRETWMPDPSCDDDGWDDADISYHQWDGCGMPMRDYPDALKTVDNVIHRASWDGHEMVGWKPSIHMPRWASRITLEITNVRIERLQDISDGDCISEGIDYIKNEEKLVLFFKDYTATEKTSSVIPRYSCDEKASFKSLWESTYQNWQQNPWVWVIEFRRLG